MQIKKKKTAYLVGIKGIAMTALAVYLVEKGFDVTGSDIDEHFPTDPVLKKLKIKIKRGFKPDNLGQRKYDYVIVTGAHGGMTNPEAQQAKKNKLSVYMHGQFIGELMKGKTGISVAGCHGKTTTSSLIATVMTLGGFDPSYLIGTAQINGLGPAGHFGKGDYFIAEADEYMTCPITDSTPRFLWQSPKFLVITNIEYDHPDAYRNIDKVKEAFRKFAMKIPRNGLVITCVDNENAMDTLKNIPADIMTYGFSPLADYQITKHYFGDGVSFMRVKSHGLDLGEFMLKVPGKHNLLNALATAIVANQTGIGWEKIRELLKHYIGSKRRFEKLSQIDGISIYDDYAHHPSEIKATISAARQWFPERRIIVIFQPHTYSRTKALFSDFARSFLEADLAIISEIYPSAREKFDPAINSKQLIIEANRQRNNVIYKKSKEEILSYLKSVVRNNDLIIAMGAGDIFTWRNDLISTIKEIQK